MPVPVMVFTIEVGNAIPTTVGNTPGLVANTNLSNTPANPPAATPPQSPSGVIITNTGRSAMAAQTFLLTASPNTKTAQGLAQPNSTSQFQVIAGNPNAATQVKLF